MMDLTNGDVAKQFALASLVLAVDVLVLNIIEIVFFVPMTAEALARRANRLARAAPFSPEINQYRFV